MNVCLGFVLNFKMGSQRNRSNKDESYICGFQN